MKSRRFLIVFVLIPLICVTMVQAQNYGTPSNLAGVWTMTVSPGTHLISFPVLPDTATLDDVLGDQFPGGDAWENSTRIVSIIDGVMVGAYFNSGSQAWEGDLEELDLRHGYWMVVPDDADPVELRLLGAAMNVDEIDMGTMSPGMNLVSAGYPFPTTYAGSGLVTSGFASAEYSVTSDRIYSWSAGNLNGAWYHPEMGWQGYGNTFQPEAGYVIIVVNGSDGFQWTRPAPGHTPHGGTRPQPPVGPGQSIQLAIPAPDFSTPPWNNPSPSRVRGR